MFMYVTMCLNSHITICTVFHSDFFPCLIVSQCVFTSFILLFCRDIPQGATLCLAVYAVYKKKKKEEKVTMIVVLTTVTCTCTYPVLCVLYMKNTILHFILQVHVACICAYYISCVMHVHVFY